MGNPLEYLKESKIKNYQNFELQLQTTEKSAKDLVKEMTNLDSSVLTYINSTEESKLSLQGFTAWLNQNTIASKAGTLALKAFAAVASMAAMAIAGMIVSKVIQSIDNYIHRVERTKEALEESISAYKNVQSEIDNLNKQLEEIDTQIESINSLGGAQVSKDGELEKLESQRQALEANLALKKEEAYLDAKKAADDAYDSFTQTVDNPYSKPVVFGMDDGEAITRNQVTSQEQAVKDAIAAWNSYEKELQNVNAQIIQTKSEMDTLADNSAERSVKENELKSLERRKTSLENDMDDAREYANKNMQNALEAKNAYDILDKSDQQLTETQSNQKDSIDDLSAVYDKFVDHVQNVKIETPEVDTSKTEKSLEKVKLFSIGDEETSKEIDDFQSKMSTLKSALQNIEDLKFSNSDLIDLEQQFPELTSASGDLSTAIKKLIDESLSSLITKFKEAGASDDLLNLLQSIANEAQGIASTDWIGTFDVFDSADSKLQSLAEMIVDLGDSYTLTATEARKYAEVFPDLLAQGQITANGLIQFNSDVVNDFVAGQQATVASDTNAQITRLENEKSVLEAKKAAAEAAIAIINGEITGENDGSHKIADIRKNLTQYLIDLGVEEQTANAATMELMAGNVSEYDRVVSEVSANVNTNLSGSIENAGSNVANQANNMINNLFKIGKQATNTAKAVASIGKEPIEAVKEDAVGSISSVYKFKTAQADAQFVKQDGFELTVDDLPDIVGDLTLKVDEYVKGIDAIDSQIALLEAKGNKPFADYLKSAKSAKDAASKGSNDKSEKDPTTFDWMERKLTIIDKQTSTLQDKIDNLVGYKAKNQVTDTVLDLLGDKLTTLEKMSARYQEQLDSIDLPEEWIEKIQSGAYDIDSLDSDKDKKLIKKIQDYQTWYDKIQDCKDKIDETTKSIKEMNLSKLDNIIDQFDQTKDILSQIIDTEKDLLDLREQQGEKISANDYISLANKQYEATKQNIEEYNRLSAEMSKLNLERGSEEWKKYNDQLQDLKDNMIAAADAVESYKDAMTELIYKDLDDYKSKLDSLNGTISTMSGLIGDTNLVDDNGELTDRGLAQLALYAQQLSNAKHEAAEYDNAIDSLNDALRTGLITQDEYNSMLYEYKSAQESAVSSVKDARDSILSLVKDGIQAEIDAKKELIDQTKAELEAEQDLHDYQESIADQQKNITNLQRQIATLSDSTNRKDIAQKLKLQSDLAEAQKKLYDTQYDHELDERKKALDDEYNTFEESKQKEMEELETDLDKQEAAISKYLDKVKKDHSTAYDVLKQYGENYNLTATDDLTEPWDSASSAADTCSDAIGNVTANIQYQINSLDFSSLYELVNLLNTIKGLGYGDGDATNSQWEDISGTGTWHKSTASGRWWYGADEDNYASDGIYTIDGKQYGFNGKGQMVTGWRNDIGEDGAWKYFEPSNGQMVRSEWRKSKDGTWYYLDHNGNLATDMAVKAKDGNGYYYVDNDGKWDGTTLSSEDVNRLKYKIGYKNGTRNASAGWHLIDEEGLGSEIIMKDGRVLHPYNFAGGETVFNKDQVQKIWDMSKGYMPGLFESKQIASVPADVSTREMTQNVNINIPIGGVVDEAALKVLQDQFLPMVKKNIKAVTDAVGKQVKYQTRW